MVLFHGLRERIKWSLFYRRQQRQVPINRRFDKLHGTDTGDELTLAEAGVPSSEVGRGNTVYRAIWEAEFHTVLRALPIDFERFTFVDYGSGKGKALLLASDYPFARIIGVEYAPLLDAIARRNIAIYRNPSQKCRHIETILQDALTYEPPDGPLVCFFFNPFDASTTTAVLERLCAAVAREPQRPVCIVYVNVRHISELAHVFERLSPFATVTQHRRYLILANPAAIAAARH